MRKAVYIVEKSVCKIKAGPLKTAMSLSEVRILRNSLNEWTCDVCRRLSARVLKKEKLDYTL